MDWNVTWACVSQNLIDELSPAALGPLRIAFNKGGSSSISQLFSNLNGMAAFTGTKRQENLQKLMAVLSSNDEWYKLPSVQKLAKHVQPAVSMENLINDAINK